MVLILAIFSDKLPLHHKVAPGVHQRDSQLTFLLGGCHSILLLLGMQQNRIWMINVFILAGIVGYGL